MRSNCAIYVDVGYLLASAATRVAGTSLRSSIHVNYGTLIEALVEQAEKVSGLRVLRVHWYDSARDGVPDAQQERIGELPRVKLRLGRFGVDGQQKGVDLRIGLDLAAHARNRTADVFFLISGDDDLTEAVEEAQVHGVQVVVVAVPNPEGKPHSVSRHLLRAADELEVLAGEVIDRAVMKVEVPPPPPPAAAARTPAAEPAPATATVAPRDVAGMARPRPTAPAAVPVYSVSSSQKTAGNVDASGDPDRYAAQIDSIIDNVLRAVRKSATPDEMAELVAAKPSIPREIDRALLLDLSAALGIYDLSDEVRFRLRARFWEVLDDG